MNIPPLQNPVSASDVPLDQLSNNRAFTEDQKVGEASRQFEAMLLRQILQETQKTVFKSEFTDNSTTSAIYQDMIVNQLADSISKSGSFGLAQSVHHQLTRQLHLTKPDGENHSPTALPTASAGREAVRPPLHSTMNSSPGISTSPANIAPVQQHE